MTLEELRERIDELDRQLVELLNERARAAQTIGHLKAATSLPVYEPGREKVIYANVREANKGPLPDIELTHIYERMIDAMVEAGVGVHRTTGAMQTILAGVGPTANVDLSKFEVMPGVMHVHRISSPYKLAGRGWRPEGTIVTFRNGVTV